MKICSKCKQNLSDDSFHKRTYKSGKVGLQTKCKACGSATRAQYYKPHTSIRLKLKLTQAEVDALVRPGKCEGCGTSEGKLCIDHDHATKKPRGLLCHNCNTALGLLKDDVQRLENLSQYLERSRQLD